MISCSELREKINRIVDAHRRGLRDKLQTVDLLGTLAATLTTQDQRELFEQLGYILRTEPLGISEAVRGVAVNVFGVTLLALARFGPVDHLAEFVFSRLRLDDQREVETWAREVSPDLRYCLYEQEHRFGEHALAQMRHSIAGSRSTDKALPLELIEALNELEVAVDSLEFRRFEQSLRRAASKDSSKAADLESWKNIPRVGAAMEEAAEYLRSQGEFDTKKAADLMRSSMDETHRFVVNELSKLRGETYSGSGQDADRRVYMRKLGFISPAEEKFFSSIYSLISEEASHKLVAPKESMLVMHTTIHNYLLLLLKRRNDWENVPLRN